MNKVEDSHQEDEEEEKGLSHISRGKMSLQEKLILEIVKKYGRIALMFDADGFPGKKLYFTKSRGGKNGSRREK